MYTRYRNTARKGFTLIEILIVVVILGILAAIVIPQFTDASTQASEASVRSQLQTIRGQLELYKVQNADTYPLLVANGWTDLVTNDYLQANPRNPLMPAGSQDTVSAPAGTGAWYWDGDDLTANDGAGATFVE